MAYSFVKALPQYNWIKDRKILKDGKHVGNLVYHNDTWRKHKWSIEDVRGIKKLCKSGYDMFDFNTAKIVAKTIF